MIHLCVSIGDAEVNDDWDDDDADHRDDDDDDADHRDDDDDMIII